VAGNVGTAAAREVLAGQRRVGSHRFLLDDVSLVDPDVPATSRNRQMTDADLLTLAPPARRPSTRSSPATVATGTSNC
jgi:hypothetical protein